MGVGGYHSFVMIVFRLIFNCPEGGVFWGSIEPSYQVCSPVEVIKSEDRRTKGTKSRKKSASNRIYFLESETRGSGSLIGQATPETEHFERYKVS